MRTNEKLIKAKQKKNRLELNLAKEREKVRKNDAHVKIQFGGLVFKSQMNEYSKAVILGALISAAENIQNNPDYLNLYKIKGEKAFID